MAKPMGNKARRRSRLMCPETALRNRILRLPDPTRPKVSTYKAADSHNSPTKVLMARAAIAQYGRNKAVTAWVITHFSVMPPDYEVCKALDDGRIGRWVDSLREHRVIGRPGGAPKFPRGRKPKRERMPEAWKRKGKEVRRKAEEEKRLHAEAVARAQTLVELQKSIDSLKGGGKGGGK